MIGRLAGTVVESRPDRVLLDVLGVGFEVAVPLGTYTVLPPVGERAVLLIHTVVREDAISLYGFATSQEKYVFEKLLSVSGIGPKVALTVLSGLPLPELVTSIVTQNARRLATIPGVGKKLAERLALELKEKMEGLGLAPSSRTARPKSSAADDAVGALVNLGYKMAHAEAAVAAAALEAGTENLQALLHAALKSLAK